MKLYHCKRCGTFIGGFGYCDELCPTCRRKETYLTKEEVVAMLTEIQTEIDEVAHYRAKDDLSLVVDMSKVNEIIKQKINSLKTESEK